MPWYGWLLAGLLVLASLTTKAVGAAWVLFAVFGIWHLRTSQRQYMADAGPLFLKIWLWVALSGFTFKAVATAYWNDPWPERHGEIRMLLGALAAYGAYAYFRRTRTAQAHSLIVWISHALSLTALLGLAWVVWQGRWQVTTHPIAWAGVMAMFGCWLLAVSLDQRFTLSHRRWWLLGSAMAVLAVLASQSRGAFMVVPWWTGVMAWQAWRHVRQTGHSGKALRQLTWTGAALVLLAAGLSFTPVLERAHQSLQHAFVEARHALQAPAEGSNSSVGARLYMWQQSLGAIAKSPWLGHGHDGRKQLIKSWAEEAQSKEIQRLGHVHNEYLHQLIDHGVLGLLSVAAWVLGVLYLVVQLRRCGAVTAALALGGIWTVYAAGNLSNVNFAHNYYTAGLSLMTGLVISLLNMPPSGQTPHAAP